MSRGGAAGSAMGAIFREMMMQAWRTMDRPAIGRLLENILDQEDLNDNHNHAQALVRYLDARASSFWRDNIVDLQKRTKLIGKLLTVISQNDLQGEMELLEESAIKPLKGLISQTLYKLLVERRTYLIAEGMQALSVFGQVRGIDEEAGSSALAPSVG